MKKKYIHMYRFRYIHLPRSFGSFVAFVQPANCSDAGFLIKLFLKSIDSKMVGDIPVISHRISPKMLGDIGTRQPPLTTPLGLQHTY